MIRVGHGRMLLSRLRGIGRLSNTRFKRLLAAYCYPRVVALGMRLSKRTEICSLMREFGSQRMETDRRDLSCLVTNYVG